MKTICSHVMAFERSMARTCRVICQVFPHCLIGYSSELEIQLTGWPRPMRPFKELGELVVTT